MNVHGDFACFRLPCPSSGGERVSALINLCWWWRSDRVYGTGRLRPSCGLHHTHQRLLAAVGPHSEQLHEARALYRLSLQGHLDMCWTVDAFAWGLLRSS